LEQSVRNISNLVDPLLQAKMASGAPFANTSEAEVYPADFQMRHKKMDVTEKVSNGLRTVQLHKSSAT
jgi:hypothetical protein